MNEIEVRSDANRRAVELDSVGMGAFFMHEDNLYLKLGNWRKENACQVTGDYVGTIRALPRNTNVTTYERFQLVITKTVGASDEV